MGIVGVWRLAAAGTCLAAFAAEAAGQHPGLEFPVNAHTTGSQTAPAVGADVDGNFVVIWNGAGPGDAQGVFGRRFDAVGTPLGDQFQVNSYTTGVQANPVAAMRSSGEFVVVWQSQDQDGSSAGIFGQTFDAAAEPAGPEFRVNDSTAYDQRDPSVAMDGNGNFIVVWQGFRPQDEGPGWHIWGRRFNNAASPLSSDFRIDAYRERGRRKPSVGADAAGNFVVAWERYLSFDGERSIESRRFDSSGAPLDAFESLVEWASQPKATMNAAGASMIAWRDDRLARLSAKTIDAAGDHVRTFVVDDPQSADYFPGYLHGHSLSADEAGQFVVAWGRAGYRYDGLYGHPYGQHVRVRTFDIAGNSVGSNLQVSTAGDAYRGRPAVAARGTGIFVVAWQSAGQDGSGSGIFGHNPDVIFADGFELGNVSAWSSSATDGGDAAVVHEAAMNTTIWDFGLRAVVDDRASLLVQNDSPAAEPRYRARFYLDPNGFDPGESVGKLRQVVFLAFSEAPLKRLVLIMLRRIGGQYAVGVHVRRDDDTLAKSAFTSITDGPHAIEFDWRKASASGASDGRFEMWIDGTSVVTLTGLDNDERSVDFVRMGALSVKAGAAGTLYFDEFVSRRLAYIGP